MYEKSEKVNDYGSGTCTKNNPREELKANVELLSIKKEGRANANAVVNIDKKEEQRRMLTKLAKDTKKIELNELTGMEPCAVAKEDLEVACEAKNVNERRVKSVTDLRKGNNTKDEKVLWKKKLAN